jgi:hypothetical protein
MGVLQAARRIVAQQGVQAERDLSRTPGPSK